MTPRPDTKLRNSQAAGSQTHSDATAARHCRTALFEQLDRWVERGWLRSLDRAFAAFLLREVSDTSPLLLLAAALASHQLGRGHVCLDLAQTLATPDLALSLPPEGDSLDEPPPLPSYVMAGLTLDEWQSALAQPALISSGPGNTPLVLVGPGNSAGDDSNQRPRLYLRRYWQYEQEIRHQLDTRLNAPDDGLEASASPERLRPLLDTLFAQSSQPSDAVDWQKAACALASRSHFAVITGGPGTGKTTTVVRLLALLQARQLGLGLPALRIRLAAPTGKAAARLNESIAGQVDRLPLSSLTRQINQHTSDEPHSSAASTTAQLQEAIPTEVSTLHRLLGARPRTRRLRYHRHQPLPLDVLVVDEASMIDVSLMAALLDALPHHARLVLLGDKDQLASVEAGSVLGDLCARAEAGHYTPATAKWLSAASGQTLSENMLDANGQPLDQAITMLRLSHRFTADSGVGQLAEAINSGGSSPVSLNEIWATSYADLSHLRVKNDDRARLAQLALSGYPEGFPRHAAHPAVGQALPPVGYRHYLEVMHSQRPTQDAPPERFDDWATDVLAAYGRFQLLCALRRGSWGVEGLNLCVREALAKEGLIKPGSEQSQWYAGRPVLVTANDYGLGLMNGDIGITLEQPHPDAPNDHLLRVAFPASDGSGHIKWVLPSRLKAVETVFAMTVHKSQGSEFDHTALVLPDLPNPILTRELVYTGITRARHWLTLVEPGRGQLNDAVKRRVVRVSGLYIR